MKYAFRRNYWKRQGVDPQMIGEEVEALIEKSGEYVDVETLYHKALSKASAFHKGLNWNDAEAAEKYRKRQIQQMMRQLCPVKNNQVQKTRAFVFIHHPGYRGKKVYMPLRSALGRQEMRDELLERAMVPLNQWIGTFGGRRELAFMKSNVERLRRKIASEMLAMT